MWPAYFKLCEELKKLNKKITRVRFDIAIGSLSLYAHATVWSD